MPVTQYIVPESIFPVCDGFLARVLEALHAEVWVTWWRWSGEPPTGLRIVNRVPIVTYGLACSDGYETYWKSSGHLSTVKRARRRCRDFRLEVNTPGASVWINQQWAQRWSVSPAELRARILAAQQMEERGQHFSLLLIDGQRWIAGHTFLVHRDDLVWLISCRDPAYDACGAGTRLMDLAFSWARDQGFRSIDLGGAHDSSKRRWAPASGTKWEFLVCRSVLSSCIERVRRRGRDAVRSCLSILRTPSDTLDTPTV